MGEKVSSGFLAQYLGSSEADVGLKTFCVVGALSQKIVSHPSAQLIILRSELRIENKQSIINRATKLKSW